MNFHKVFSARLFSAFFIFKKKVFTLIVNVLYACELSTCDTYAEEDARRLPNTLSVGVRGISASVLLTDLADQVAASAGAACHTGEAAASISGVLMVPGGGNGVTHHTCVSRDNLTFTHV